MVTQLALLGEAAAYHQRGCSCTLEEAAEGLYELQHWLSTEERDLPRVEAGSASAEFDLRLAPVSCWMPNSIFTQLYRIYENTCSASGAERRNLGWL